MRGTAGRRALLAALLLSAVPALAQAPSPVGLWRTFDDRTGRESGLVRIFEQGGRLYGRVEAITDPAKRGGRCQNCEGDRRDQPVLGMVVMRDLRPDGDEWDGGNIIDPETGRIYRCLLRLTDGGRRLVLRGFIGVSLFGRSQTWVRAG